MSSRLIGVLIGLIIGGSIAAGIVYLQIQELTEEAAGSSATQLGEADIGGAFELVDGAGKTVTDADFAGRPMLIYFGFTWCPDICPTELGVMAATLDMLPEPVAETIQPVFITIDPERDTPEAVADYAGMFHPRMIGLTGSPEQIRHVADVYKVYYAKVDLPDADDYTMDHSSFTYLMSAEGDFLDVFPYGTPPADMAARIAAHLDRTDS